MIFTSSMAAEMALPMSVAYSAEKIFTTYLAQGYSIEMGDKIECMSFNPAEVATKMIMKDESQSGGLTVTT
jgi:short-subunit dehydrogenase